MNIHDANDMQSHKLRDAMFDEDDTFCPPSFDEKIYYDESMAYCSASPVSALVSDSNMGIITWCLAF